VRDRIPERTPEQKRRAYVDNMKVWNALGLTGLHAMMGKPELLDVVRDLEAAGDLTLRLRMPLWVEPEMTLEEMRGWLPYRNERGRRWTGGTAKFFIDGTIEGGTAWLIEPDTEGASHQAYWPDPAHYTAAVDLFAKAGFQCVTHAVGDMAVRHALDAYKAAGPVPNAMHRVEHIEVLHDEDLPRFAKLNVAASMQPLHMAMFEAEGHDEWSRRVGPERRKLAFRTQDLIQSGAALALGSDWGVAPYDPRLGMAWARLRRTPGRPEKGAIEPRQALTGLQTLAGYTTEAARVLGDQSVAGKIKEGYRADLSAFAADLVDTPPDDLLSVPTRLTVVDGEVTFQSE
jgi:predicted amidohydrolase YtcJ